MRARILSDDAHLETACPAIEERLTGVRSHARRLVTNLACVGTACVLAVFVFSDTASGEMLFADATFLDGYEAVTIPATFKDRVIIEPLEAASP